MFDKLRRALGGLIEKVSTKELSEEDINEVLEDFKMQLIESDVAYSVAEELAEKVKEALLGARIKRGIDIASLVRKALEEQLVKILGTEAPDLVEEARRICGSGEPLRIVFLGVNGVGKTTTIAKIAKLFRDAGITPVLAAADTFRAGAQEQLKIHAEKLGVPIVTGRYGADPASVAYDAVAHARSRGYCAVLIDTAGRMHVNRDLVEELKKIVRVVKPHYKILVVDALTGNDAVEQARFFNEAVGVDLVVLTKVDADAKGGSALSVAYEIGKPIVFIGTGQDYEDLERTNARLLVQRILG